MFLTNETDATYIRFIGINNEAYITGIIYFI
jgi:hypothetical protein